MAVEADAEQEGTMMEFKTKAELLKHYREVRGRFVFAAPPAPKPEPVPEPEPEPEPAPPPPPLPRHTFRRIARIVCEHYCVPWEALCNPRRFQHLIEPRHVYFYLCREVGKQSFPRIGRFIGRDHSSVLHGHRKIAERIESDEELAAAIAAMTARFTSEDAATGEGE